MNNIMAMANCITLKLPGFDEGDVQKTKGNELILLLPLVLLLTILLVLELLLLALLLLLQRFLFKLWLKVRRGNFQGTLRGEFELNHNTPSARRLTNGRNHQCIRKDLVCEAETCRTC